MSVIDSLGRNAPPLTVICVLGSPAVTSSERNALVGVGVGGGVGVGVGHVDVSEALQARRICACAMGASATSATAEPIAPMTGARERSLAEIPGKRIETREGYQFAGRAQGAFEPGARRSHVIRRTARVSTRLRWVPGNATRGRAPR